MAPLLTTHPDQHLEPDPDRVIGRLFLPTAELPYVHRAQEIVARVLALDDDAVDDAVAALLTHFGVNHHDLVATLTANGAVLAPPDVHVGEARLILLGSAFTAEYAIEGAALCNPSVVPHPDQSGLADGELRVAVSLRGIGEGHRSTLEFVSAVITDRTWTFSGRGPAPVTGAVASHALPRELFAELARGGREPDDLSAAVLAALPHRVGSGEIEDVLADLHPDLLLGPQAQDRVLRLRTWSRAGYTVSFADDTHLEQRVLLPSAEDESHGIEDARFTLVKEDGGQNYRACYTAYDGLSVRNRVLVSPDLRVFRSYPLAGPGAQNKGMALFPRPIHGRRLALTRADGTNVGVSASEDGYYWHEPVVIETPQATWQLLKVGNGSPPLETDAGWLVITHGVGLMRSYSLGAILLDLDDPTRVVARLDEPLLAPVAHAGYVPNVVFSCGAVIHRGRLFVPYGVGDAKIGVGSVPVDDLLDAMTPVLQSRAVGFETPGSGYSEDIRHTKEEIMGLDDKAKNLAQDAAGKLKEAWGKATDDEQVEAEGRADQTAADVKQAGENVKDIFRN